MNPGRTGRGCAPSGVAGDEPEEGFPGAMPKKKLRNRLNFFARILHDKGRGPSILGNTWNEEATDGWLETERPGETKTSREKS